MVPYCVGKLKKCNKNAYELVTKSCQKNVYIFMTKENTMNLTPIKANMNEIETAEYKILFSYKTPVAAILNDGSSFKTSKKWSQTTTRHINSWFSMQGTDVNAPQEKPQEYFDGLGK